MAQSIWCHATGRTTGHLHSVQTGSRVHVVPYPMGTVVNFPGVKRPGHEAEHSLPSSAYVKKSGTTPPLPLKFSWHNA
jgi:hypothetical protein